jgi:hypothetical protein
VDMFFARDRNFVTPATFVGRGSLTLAVVQLPCMVFALQHY